MIVDCRGQEITAGCMVVVPTAEGGLCECEVKAVETGRPGFVKLGVGADDDQRQWMPADRVAVVTTVVTTVVREHPWERHGDYSG